jgi:hypothetical protein
MADEPIGSGSGLGSRPVNQDNGVIASLFLSISRVNRQAILVLPRAPEALITAQISASQGGFT